MPNHENEHEPVIIHVNADGTLSSSVDPLPWWAIAHMNSDMYGHPPAEDQHLDHQSWKDEKESEEPLEPEKQNGEPTDEPQL